MFVRNPGEIAVSVGVLGVLIILGAALIALWVDVRFPRLAPGDLRRAFLHLGIGLVAARIVLPLAGYATAQFDSPVARLVEVFGVAFPILVYCLLGGLWTIKLAQRALLGSYR